METKSLNKRVVSVLLTVAMLMGFFPMYIDDFKADAASSGTFHVSGTKILDANNNEFVMRGINHAYIWCQKNNDSAMRGMANTGANCVRLVFTTGKHHSYFQRGWVDGDWNDPETTSAELEDCIKKAIDNRLVPIVEVHDATGVDNFQALQDSADYWMKSDIKNVLKKYEKYVILNIANEWHGTHDGAAWADGYKKVIPQIRNAGINNMIMVDAAGWGQSADSLKYYGKEVFNSDPDKNVVLSQHMYSCFDSDSKVTDVIDNVLSQNIPMVVGEFGWAHGGVLVASDKVMSYCQQKNVGYLAWSWYGNGGSDRVLDMTSDPEGNSLTDWGRTAVNHIKSTSRICSIFGNPPPPSSSEESSSSRVEPNPDKEKVLWTGSVPFDNWNNMVTINGGIGKWNDASLKVDFASSSSGQIQLAYENASGDYIKIVDYTNFSGDSYTFDLSQDELKALASAKKIFVKGTGATATKVSVINNEIPDSSSEIDSSSNIEESSSEAPDPSGKDVDVLWTGSFDCGQWTGSNGKDYMEVETGIGAWDEAALKVDFEITGTKPQIQFAYADEKAGAWNYYLGENLKTEKEKADASTISVKGTSHTINLSKYALSELNNAQKLYFKGNNVIIKKVTVLGAKFGGPYDRHHISKKLWTGKKVFKGWDDVLAIKGNIGKGLTEAAIRVDYTKNIPALDTCLQLDCRDPQGEFTILISSVQSRSATTYTFILTPELITALSDCQEVIIKGANYTATSVSLVVPGENPLPEPDDGKDISKCNISVTSSRVYSGAAIKPAVTVKDGSTTLKNGTDYTVSYSNNTNAGKATVTISGKGNYTGKATKTFTITTKKLSDCTVSLHKTSYTYNGTSLKPTVTVKIGSKTISSNNYTVKYENNRRAGTATVTVTGKGNLRNSVKKTFTITKRSLSACDVTLEKTSYNYTGKAIKPAVTVKVNGVVVYKGTYKVTYKNNTKKGTATVTITANSTDSDLKGSVSKTFKIK